METPPSTTRLIHVFLLLGAPFTTGYTMILSLIGNPLWEPRDQWFGVFVTGATIGAIVAGWTMQFRGRLWTKSLAGILICFAYLFTLTSNPFAIARLVCGFTSGLVIVCVPVYVAELSPSYARGAFGAGIQLSFSLGILAFIIVRYLSSWTPTPFLAYMIHFFVFIPTMVTPCIVPDKKERNDVISWSDFKSSQLVGPVAMSAMVMVFQRIFEFQILMFYMTTGASDKFASTLGNNLTIGDNVSVIVAVNQVVSTLVTCWLMDRLGRRKLLIISGCLMCMSYICLSVLFTSDAHNDKFIYKMLTCLIIYVIGYSVGWGPVPMILLPEFMPTRARDLITSFAIFVSWLGAYIVKYYFISLHEGLNHASFYWLLACICALSVLYAWWKIPERKGESLEVLWTYDYDGASAILERNSVI